MSPLNSLINCSAELSNTSSVLFSSVSSRIVNTLCIPFELSAIFENAIKLPFQTAAFIVKVPAKICKVLACSATLAEFESSLSGPTDILKTVLKIVGYAVGVLFTTTLGMICPYKNFRLHCTFGLTTNKHAERALRLAEEKKRNEIVNHEKIIERRVKDLIEAMRQKAEPVTQLTLEDRQEIENLTHVPYPPLEKLIEASKVIEEQSLSEQPTLNKEQGVKEVEISKKEPLEDPCQNAKEKIQPFENLGIAVVSG